MNRVIQHVDSCEKPGEVQVRLALERFRTIIYKDSVFFLITYFRSEYTTKYFVIRQPVTVINTYSTKSQTRLNIYCILFLVLVAVSAPELHLSETFKYLAIMVDTAWDPNLLFIINLSLQHDIIFIVPKNS